MQIVAYLLAALLGFGGLVFVVGSQGQVLRIVVGVILMAGAGVLVYLVRVRPQPGQTNLTITQKIELSGDVNLQNLTCKNCGGRLTEKSITVKAGAVFVNCEYCGTAYQLEEEPKW
jgi:hypothetical protein